MKILILEDLQLDGRSFTAGEIALLGAEDAEKAIATGKASKEETNRSVGLKTSDATIPNKRGKK
jgi:predicted RNA-binding protein associated with RNAse of E/G family